MTSGLPSPSESARLTRALAILQQRTVPSVISVDEALSGNLGETLSGGSLVGSNPAESMGGAHVVSNAMRPDATAWRSARSAVVLPGSFNPLHVAHVLLLEAAMHALPRGAMATDAVAALSLSVNTIDKAKPNGMALEDRAWTMRTTLAGSEGLVPSAALLASHGLYLDQATGLRAAMPRLGPDGLWFAIGHDKAVQIFDARYYTDRDASLEELFSRAGLLVAPRAGASTSDLNDLVGRPENRRFADRVRSIALPDLVSRLSSTAVRSGGVTSDVLPASVATMIAARQCYAEDSEATVRARSDSAAAANAV
jgi:nicotinic acid mononucleotide adenylyltransferase